MNKVNRSKQKNHNNKSINDCRNNDKNNSKSLVALIMNHTYA